ncbi:MAG: hypothetical protein WCX79_04020 [Candidatus Paceibacterota bacterium]|jgi:hypothetical protein
MNYKKYLPSKKFLIVMGSIFGAVAVIFLLLYIFSGKTNFISDESKKDSLVVQNKTIASVVAQDTDSDGVPDWKEKLWATDINNKTSFEDIPDAVYISNKMKEKNLEEKITLEEENLTETEKFAREFFATYVALKTTDGADTEMIKNFSSALGESVVNVEPTNTYTEEDLILSSEDTPDSHKRYYIAIQSLYNSHKKNGLGKELGIVSEGLVTSERMGENSENYADLLLIGQTYKEFAKDMMKEAVPKSLSGHHLNIANSADGTGVAVLNLQKIVDDPILGIAGLSQYQKYSTELISAVSTLEEVLEKE